MKRKIYNVTYKQLIETLNNSSMKIICLTGKMASGKNYICTKLENQGWTSIDADILVHQAIEIARDTILDNFEPYAKEKKIKLTKDNGSINRRALGELLFSMPGLLKIQESIIYPIITKMINDFIAEHSKVIINATVLFKTPEIMNLCESIVYVKAPLITRIKRARKRDNLPYSQIFKRFYAQRNLLNNYKSFINPIYIIKNI